MPKFNFRQSLCEQKRKWVEHCHSTHFRFIKLTIRISFRKVYIKSIIQTWNIFIPEIPTRFVIETVAPHW